ncbi:hypothetical protein SO802_004400 [Lithocarpus litseifolius]|uniref:Uncharacterized protein n=1 Tax=Lithocarpus litseifolius TaxID=425828 RepID=A0AAW2E8I0_9ROSI
MAPKKSKSTPSQNPLHSEASSSSSVDPTPSHVQFCDDKSRQDFPKNFSRRGIHLERQVVLLEFYDTNLPIVVYSRGMRIIVTPDLISEVLHVPRVAHLDYLDCRHLKAVSKDELMSLIC